MCSSDLKFWYDYYSYYYRDSDWNDSIYASATKYSERQQQTWGYTPRQTPASNPATQQILSAVRIYSLHNKKFAEYTLINPFITQFQHGEHSQGTDGGTLENTMTIQYQAVKYEYGQVSEDTVTGFAYLTYDSRPSPMGTTNITDRNVHDLNEGLTGLPGILNNIKNINGAAIVGGALSAAGSGLLTGALGFGVANAGAGIKAIAGSASDLLGRAKSGLGKVLSNGQKIDGITSAGDLNLPSDAPGAETTNSIQAKIDQVTAQIAADEQAIEQANADLEAGKAEQAQLEAQIESDTYTLEYDPNLTEEDIAALQQIIDDNKAKLANVIDNNATLEENIGGLTDAVLENQYKLDELQRAQDPSGNSPEEGGAGSADSKTEYDPESGETITTNPDGSTTVVSADGSVYTTPQQNATDYPNASSNQSEPYPDP